MRGANVGNETDHRLWHREERTLARDTVTAGDREPGAAAHDDAVPKRDLRLRTGGDGGVEGVLVAEEGVRE